MIYGKLEIQVYHNLPYRQDEIFIWREMGDETEIAEIENGRLIFKKNSILKDPKPLLIMRSSEMPYLLDALIKAGIKPARELINFDNSEIKRLEAHLEDMRSLVFDKIKKGENHE